MKIVMMLAMSTSLAQAASTTTAHRPKNPRARAFSITTTMHQPYKKLVAHLCSQRSGPSQVTPPQKNPEPAPAKLPQPDRPRVAPAPPIPTEPDYDTIDSRQTPRNIPTTPNAQPRVSVLSPLWEHVKNALNKLPQIIEVS